MFVRTLLLVVMLAFAPAVQAQVAVDDCLSYDRIDSSCQERLGLSEPLQRFKRHVAEAMHRLGLTGKQAYVVTHDDNVQAPLAWYQPLGETTWLPAHLFYVQMSVLLSGGSAMEYAALNAACQAMYTGDNALKLDELLGHPRGYHASFETSLENQCVKLLTGNRYEKYMTPVSNYNVAGRS